MIIERAVNNNLSTSELESIYSTAESHMNIDNFLTSTETIANTDSWEFITPIELIADIILKIAGLKHGDNSSDNGIKEIGTEEKLDFFWKLKQRVIWMLHNLNSKTGTWDQLMFKYEENEKLQSNQNLAMQFSNTLINYNNKGASHDLLSYNEYLKFWSSLTNLITKIFGEQFNLISASSLNFKIQAIISDILTKLLITCGTPKLVNPAPFYKVQDLMTNVAGHFYWLEKSSIFLKWVIFYDVCLFQVESRDVLKVKENLSSNDNIIISYLDSLSQSSNSSSTNADCYLIAIKHYFSKSNLITYLSQEESEKLTYNQNKKLTLILKTIIADYKIFINPRTFIENLNTIIEKREKNLRETLLNNSSKIMHNLPKLFMLLGNGSSGGVSGKMQQERMIEESLMNDPVIGKLKNFRDLVVEQEKTGEDKLQPKDKGCTDEEGKTGNSNNNAGVQVSMSKITDHNRVEVLDERILDNPKDRYKYESEINSVLKLFEKIF